MLSFRNVFCFFRKLPFLNLPSSIQFIQSLTPSFLTPSFFLFSLFLHAYSGYAVTMIFIVLTMMLKIVDVAYEKVRFETLFQEGKKENFPIQVKLAFRKIIFDLYWRFRVRATIQSAKITEQTIEKMRSNGKSLNDAMSKKSGIGLFRSNTIIDESVADLIRVETEEEKEAKRKKAEEAEKARKKKVSCLLLSLGGNKLQNRTHLVAGRLPTFISNQSTTPTVLIINPCDSVLAGKA